MRWHLLNPYLRFINWFMFSRFQDYRLLESLIECYRVLQSVTECYRVLQSISSASTWSNFWACLWYINADRSEEESTGLIIMIQVDAVYTNAKICGNLASSYPTPSVCLRYHFQLPLPLTLLNLKLKHQLKHVQPNQVLRFRPLPIVWSSNSGSRACHAQL